jgi:hypothetical protein
LLRIRLEFSLHPNCSAEGRNVSSDFSTTAAAYSILSEPVSNTKSRSAADKYKGCTDNVFAGYPAGRISC